MISWSQGKLAITQAQLKLLLLAAFFLFMNNLFFIIGDKFLNSVNAAAFTPSQVVWTLLISLLLKLEKFSWNKIIGILFSTSGAVWMTF